MDETRSSAPGHVEATPEAEPLDPAAASARSSALAPADQPPSQESSSSSGPSATPSAPQDRVGEIGRDLGQRLKPVAVAAEGIAAQALDLSAKGLSRLAAMLEERRRRRDDGQSSR